jgi:copper chaperone
MREEQIHVPEIHCDHCKTSIEGAVKAVSGVEFVEVDVPRKFVTVNYDEQAVDLDQIKTAIEDQGYDIPA